MRNLLGTVALLVIIVAAVGYSRNWFSVQRTSAGTETELNIQIDRAKIREDTQNAARVARELKDNLRKKLAERQQADSEATR